MMNVNIETINTCNNDEESIECIDLVSDEEDSSVIMSSRNRKINKLHFMDDQSSQNSSENDNNVKEELMESNSNDSFYSERSSWTKDDTIRLIHIVNKVGRHWIMIADKYKSHL